jgi:DNA-binding transcriptional LysR family regulator
MAAPAERLNVTQPGLSHQFQALEQEAGGLLVERLPRAVRLTSAGRAMLPHARAAMAEACRATTAARRATGAVGGELDLATLFTISIGILPAMHTDDPVAQGRNERVILNDLAARRWVHFTLGRQLRGAGLGPILVPAEIIPPHFGSLLLLPDRRRVHRHPRERGADHARVRPQAAGPGPRRLLDHGRLSPGGMTSRSAARATPLRAACDNDDCE